jgi:hypothetical protein
MCKSNEDHLLPVEIVGKTEVWTEIAQLQDRVMWDWLFVAARRQTRRREGGCCGGLLTRQILRDPFGQRRVRIAT